MTRKSITTAINPKIPFRLRYFRMDCLIRWIVLAGLLGINGIVRLCLINTTANAAKLIFSIVLLILGFLVVTELLMIQLRLLRTSIYWRYDHSKATWTNRLEGIKDGSKHLYSLTTLTQVPKTVRKEIRSAAKAADLALWHTMRDYKSIAKFIKLSDSHDFLRAFIKIAESRETSLRGLVQEADTACLRTLTLQPDDQHIQVFLNDFRARRAALDEIDALIKAA